MPRPADDRDGLWTRPRPRPRPHTERGVSTRRRSGPGAGADAFAGRSGLSLTLAPLGASYGCPVRADGQWWVQEREDEPSRSPAGHARSAGRSDAQSGARSPTASRGPGEGGKIRRPRAVALSDDPGATAGRYGAHGGQLRRREVLRPVRQGRFMGVPTPTGASGHLTRTRRESEQLAPIGVGSHNVG